MFCEAAAAKAEIRGNRGKLFLPVSFKASKNPLGWSRALGSVTWFLPGSNTLVVGERKLQKKFSIALLLSVIFILQQLL